MSVPVTIRPYDPADFTFIMGSWLATAADSRWARRVNADDGLAYYASQLEPGRGRPSAFYGLHRRYIRRCLEEDENVAVVVACSADDTDLVLGYSVANVASNVLLYICVKRQYQKFGIGKALFEAAKNLGRLGMQWEVSPHIEHEAGRISWMEEARRNLSVDHGVIV